MFNISRPLYIEVFQVIVLVLAFWILKPFLTAIVVASILAVNTVQLSYFYEKKLFKRVMPNCRALLTVFTILLLVIVPISFLLTNLGSQIIGFLKTDFSTIASQITTVQIAGYKLNFAIIETLQLKLLEHSQTIIQHFATYSLNTIKLIGNSFTQTLVFLLLYFYILRDWNLIEAKLFSKKSKLLNSITSLAKTLFQGTLFLSLISAFLVLIGFYLFNIPSPLVFAIATFFLALIPTIGTIIIYLIGLIFILANFSYLSLILFITYYLGFEFLLKENYLKPKLLEDKLDLHPILVFLAITGGIQAFGPAGIIYGPAILLTFLAIFFSSKYK